MANRNGKLLNDICLSKNYSPKSNIPHICSWVWPRCWILRPSDELRGLWLWTPRLRPPTFHWNKMRTTFGIPVSHQYREQLRQVVDQIWSGPNSYPHDISDQFISAAYATGWHTAMTIIPSPSGCCSCGSALPRSVGVRTAAPSCRCGCRRPGQDGQVTGAKMCQSNAPWVPGCLTNLATIWYYIWLCLEEMTLRLLQFSEVILWYQGVWIWEKKEMKWKIQHQTNSSDDISGFIT